LTAAKELFRVLYCLLPGSGLRIAEALGLEIGKHFSLVREYIGSRKNGFLFETSGGLPMSPRNIMRDSLHPILKEMGRESAGFHTFRRFRESILQMSEARTLLIDYWMGHTNEEMSGRYGKQLLDNVQWRQECATKVGLGFVLPTNKQQLLIDKSGQVLRVQEQVAIAV
jgi:hypothetical protein